MISKKVKNKLAGSLYSRNMRLGAVVIATQYIANNSDIIQQMVPTEYRELAGYILGAAIWIGRWVTDRPLDQRGKYR